MINYILSTIRQFPTAIAQINHRIPHLVNPKILEILIWLAPRYAIRQLTTAIAHQLITVKLATSSCKS
ncbi:MAG: hypothetical protein ACK5HC_11080 [Dolichospermum sp.]|jgi:hypothetical protein|nr:hypothetical protein [Anabaena sp. 49628_E55]